MRFLRATGSVCGMGVLLLLSGCGGDGGRQEVSGTVTLHDDLLDKGSIQFLFTGDNKGAAGGAVISGGKFHIPKEQGLTPGRYRVVINSADESAAKVAAGETPGPLGDDKASKPIHVVNKERIPEKFNVKSTAIIEVKAKGANVFEFEIP